MRTLILFISLFAISISHAQVGIGTTSPSASAVLDLTSTTKGFLGPRLTESQKQNISSPTEGLIIFNSSDSLFQFYDGSAWKNNKNAICVLVDAGDTVQFGNLRVKLSSSGNKSLMISTVTGTADISGTSLNYTYSSTATSSGAVGTLTSYMRSSDAFNTTFQYWESSYNLAYRGNIQEILLMDETNQMAYRIKITAAGSYTDNSLEIEKLK